MIEREIERDDSLSNWRFKLTANQFRCIQLPKDRAPITFLKHEEVSGGASTKRRRGG